MTVAFIGSAAAVLNYRPTNTPISSVTGIYVAGPLDQINTWVAQWGLALQALGGTILAICAVLVGIKLGAKSVTSNGTSSGHREAVGAIFGLAIAGILIGAALLIVPMLIGVGSNSGPTPAPAPAPATAPA
jgi:hypothetical protein